jgi:transglutaminase-like putative cysteine protease
MQINVLSQRALFFLFTSVLLSLFLHFEFLPAWTLILAPSVIACRYAIYIGKVKSPNAFIKSLLVLAGFSGVYFSYGLSLSIESTVTLLVAGLALKPLEVQSKRDSYVLIFLCYFVQSQHFLFDQGPLAFILVLICLFCTLLAQVVINQSEQSTSHVKVVSKIFLLSIPLTVFLFFILPRLGPLWSLNIPTKSGVVGLSNSMSPGDVSELGKSDELAFRVKFEGDVPPINERYWRALILDYYTGETWDSRYTTEIDWALSRQSLSEPSYRYEVISEAHEQRWLFALAGSLPLQRDIGVTEDGLLKNKYKALNTFQYRAPAPMTGGGIQTQSGRDFLRPLERQAYLQLPNPNLNRKAQMLSKEIKSQARGALEFLDGISRFYRSQSYFYTLSPGVLSSDSRIDEFLFDTQAGFCAHYSGSLVYLLRSAGVPARVVLGYLGGELNNVGGYYSVYQYDAHAWVEMWVENEGWMRVDPTGWVSPERVESGMERAVSQEFVGFKTSSQWIKNMRQQFQALNFYWNEWMLNYKGSKQQEFLDSIFGKRDAFSLFLTMSGIFIGLLSFIFLIVMGGRVFSRDTRQIRFFNDYLKKLNRLGLDVNNAMTFMQIEARLVARYPGCQREASNLTRSLNKAFFERGISDFDKDTHLRNRALLNQVIKVCRKK